MFQLEEILTGLRYLGQIPGFLRHPLTMDEAHAILQRRSGASSQRLPALDPRGLVGLHGPGVQPARVGSRGLVLAHELQRAGATSPVPLERARDALGRAPRSAAAAPPYPSLRERSGADHALDRARPRRGGQPESRWVRELGCSPLPASDLRGSRLARRTVLGAWRTPDDARLDAIHQTGAECRARYGTVEAGRPGYACFAPVAPDEVHVTHDLSAVIQVGPDGGMSSLVSGALLVSSLRPTAPFLLLNVSLGDRAVLDSRSCGCPLEGLGWTIHLHKIRSFEKLTAGGMNFLDADVIRVLEEVLPARFGGGPTNYQLVEDEGNDARPRLRLLVRPEIGPVEAAAVADAFLAAVAAGSGVERVMGILWRDARMVRVERRPPLTTATGKILHLHGGGQRSSGVESGMR